MTDATDILLTHDESSGVRILTLNRPEKRNALNRALMSALLAAIEAADEAPGVGAIILTGAGRGFCAGKDVSEFDPATTDAEIAAQVDVSVRLYSIFSEVSKPIVGAINGFAVGGGCGLAAACDVVISSDKAKFGYPEVTRGAVPAIVLPGLVRQLGRKAAFELVGTGDLIDADKAQQLGLVNRVVPEADLMNEARRVAGGMAAASRNALGLTKRLFYKVVDEPFTAAMARAREANISMRRFDIKSKV